MKLIIDSSILIDNLRGGTVWDMILEDIEGKDAELIIPTIVIFELFSGKSTLQQDIKIKINSLLKIFHKIELTEAIAIKAGELARDVGKHIDPEDYIIAASALELNATVVTLNKKHFEQITNLSLYPL